VRNSQRVPAVLKTGGNRSYRLSFAPPKSHPCSVLTEEGGKQWKQTTKEEHS